MIDELHIHDLALIRDARLELAPGFNVITGETGAGKTMILSGLKLLMGERAVSALASDTIAPSVEALFTSDAFEEGELVISRKILEAGKNRCSINGELSTVRGLSSAVGPLIDLHGQHDHQRLLKPAEQLRLFDAFIGKMALSALETYYEARKAYLEAKDALAVLEEKQATANQETDLARFALYEIDLVNPVEGEYEELEEQLPRLQNTEALLTAATTACEALGGEGKANEQIAQALSLLYRLKGVDAKLDELTDRLDSILPLTEDLSLDFASYKADFEFDSSALERTLNRLGELSGLMRKYGPTMQEVFARKEAAKLTLATNESLDDLLASAKHALQESKMKLCETGSALSKVREAAKDSFCEALAQSVHELAMSSALFELKITELPFDDWRDLGPQTVEIYYQPASNLASQPLAKIASGGELSRVMLSLHQMVDMNTDDEAQTLIFDEIDTGIGGSTALAVGRRLAELAKQKQLIVVTHLPQIAAFADKHFVINKSVDENGEAETTVALVSDKTREEEIARMLSGSIDDASLSAARALLDN